MKEKAIKQVERFLNAWKGKKFKDILETTQFAWREENTIKDVRSLFSGLNLQSYEVIEVNQVADALVRIAVEMKINAETFVSAIDVVFESGKHRTNPDGEPGVHPISALRYKLIETSE